MTRLFVLLFCISLSLPAYSVIGSGGTLSGCTVVVDNIAYSDGDCDGIIDSVGEAPVWSSTPNASGTAGASGSTSLLQFLTGDPVPTAVLQSGTLPACASVTNSILSWTGACTEGVTSSLIYRATNANGTADSLSATLTFLAAPVPGADYPVAWESNFTLPAQDVNGWSIFTPSSDSRLIYVSATDGNDGTAQTYLPADAEIGADYQNPVGSILPYATIGAAFAQRRDNFPDYVLFKRGDTWYGGLGGGVGRSITERSVTSYYGSATARPEFLTGQGDGVAVASDLYSAIVGLGFRAHERDPGDPAFVGFASNGGKGISGTSSTLTGLIIEDCKFDWYDENTVQAYQTTELVDLIFRRNIFSNNYPTSGHSQGFYSAATSTFFEENIFYHNGWYEPAGGNAGATIYNHSIYFPNVRRTIFRKNIFISPSSINMKFTSQPQTGTNTIEAWEILIDNNFLLDANVAISAGGNDNQDANDGPRWRDMYIVNNVTMGNGVTDASDQGIGWGIEANDWESGAIIGNVMSRWGSATVANVWAMLIRGHVNNLEVNDNILYDVAGEVYGNNLLNIATLSDVSAISFTDNQFIQPSSDGDVNKLISYVSDPNISWSSNTYYSSGSTASWFTYNSVATSTAQWTTNTGETGGSFALPAYVAPARNIETYMSSIGETPTQAAYVVLLLQQSKFNYDTRLTADAVNSYIRAGFEL